MCYIPRINDGPVGLASGGDAAMQRSSESPVEITVWERIVRFDIPSVRDFMIVTGDTARRLRGPRIALDGTAGATPEQFR